MSDYPTIPTLFDANGQVINSAYAPVTSRPAQALYSSQGGIPALGSDYGSPAKAQIPHVDSAGNIYTIPASATQAGTAVASASSVVGNVMLALQSLTPTAAQMDGVGNIYAAPLQSPTFSVIGTAVSLSSGKSLLAVLNKSTSSVLRLLAVYAQNTATNPTTYTAYYIFAEQLHFFTSMSGGSSLTAGAFDTADTLPAGVTAATNATISGEVTPALRRWISSTYALSPGSTAAENTTGDEQGRNPWFNHMDPGSKPIVIRPGNGVHLKAVTTSTNGVQDVTFICSVAPA